MKLRKFEYVYFSRTDFIDLWMNTVLLLMSFNLFFFEPLEKINVYHFMVSRGFSSTCFSILTFILSVANIIRIFVPIKPNILLTLILKTLTLMVFLLLSIHIIDNPALPISFAFYFMCAMLAFDNLLRTK